MKNLLALASAALIAVAAPAPSIAQSVPPKAPVDSTGIVPKAIATLQIPPSITQQDVKNIFDNSVANQAAATGGVPPGYVEQNVAMGPRSIPVSGSAYDMNYYTGLGYPVYQVGDLSAQDPCAGNYSPRVLYVPQGPENCGESTCTPGAPPQAYVCEPQGTRTTLVKTIGAQLLTVTQSMLTAMSAPNTVGMSVQAATAVCQAKGYTNYVSGTVSSTQPYDCGYQITRWSGSAFYSDNACYNNVMHGLQCWK